ncbi:MAG: restriction endonuclease subunit S [Oscillospiraceae bacterium]|nr:restriction endonuclease subunit S [Oscillospiraceae bacterium]
MKYKLSEIMDIIGGGTPKTSKQEYWNGDIPWLSVKDFNNDYRYVYVTEKTITQAGLENSSTKMLKRNDTIISARGTVGEMAMIPFPMAFNQSCYGLRAKEDIVAPEYLYYLVKHNVGALQKNTHGSVFDTITRETFNGIEVVLPSLEEQMKVVSVLSDVDDKIELNNEINKNLEQQTQAIFRSWFIDFEPFNFTQPADWYQGTVDDLAQEIICGKTPSTKKKEYYGDYIPFITIPDMHDCVYAVTTERSLSKLGEDSQPRKTLPVNSVAVSCIGTAGLVVLVSCPSQTNQQINSIVPRIGFSPYYIYLLMQTMSETINRLGQSGSTIVNLNKAQFGKMKVLIPSVSAMSEFDITVSPLFELILANQHENISLAALRDSLLPKLMSGELDVSNLSI